MKVMICPECKEVLLNDELRGSNLQCHACMTRENRDDLVEIDTEDIMKGINNAGAQYQSDRNSLPFEDQNRFGSNASEIPGLSQLPGPLRRMVEKGLAMAEEEQRPARIIHSLNELDLVPGASWQKSSEWDNSQTLQLNSQASKFMLFFSILWLAISVGIFCPMLLSMFEDPSSITVNNHPGTKSDIWFLLVFAVIFVGVGLIMLYFGITSCFSKTWIDVSQDSLAVERSLFRRGKKTIIKRDPTTAVTMKSTLKVNGTPLYAVFISYGREVKIANGLEYHQACSLVRMLKELLAAEI